MDSFNSQNIPLKTAIPLSPFGARSRHRAREETGIRWTRNRPNWTVLDRIMAADRRLGRQVAVQGWLTNAWARACLWKQAFVGKRAALKAKTLVPRKCSSERTTYSKRRARVGKALCSLPLQTNSLGTREWHVGHKNDKGYGGACSSLPPMPNAPGSRETSQVPNFQSS